MTPAPARLLDGNEALDGPALPRLWRGFMRARVFFGGMLLLLQGVAYELGQAVHGATLTLSVAYLIATLLGLAFMRVHPLMRNFGLAWLTTVGIDLATFALLQSLQQSSVNFTPLFALPVLMSAVLGSLMVGLGTTAVAALLLLADAGWRWLGDAGDPSARLLQAALTGSGFFVVALLMRELALRLARQEMLALRSRDAAQLQSQVNRVVIETLVEGVLVVDARGMVQAANPAVHAMLGLTLPFVSFSLAGHPAWQALATLAHDTLTQREAQLIEMPIAQPQGAAREIRVRTRLTAPDDPRNDSLCVMFLQDMRELEARIRTEKLAAMGRMSAAVAHEIRNPLAAITQANALLAEDITDPTQRKLTAIVEHNAHRLARIVDEVLDVARARQQDAPPSTVLVAMVLDLTVQALAREWAHQTRREGLQLALEAGACAVRFEVEHLRRILVNLLDNASRYAGTGIGAICVSTQASAGQHASLRVWSNGAPIDAAVERHLFEPFFSSESRSSGLGLFLCRELCERHGATLGYRRCALTPMGIEGNEFFVVFAPASGARSPFSFSESAALS